MSYAVYKTPAIVLRSIPDREANADVVFLTRDLGKITVRAQAARKLESKHRMQLARYNHVMIDVVRGAHIWRLTGIHQVAQHHLFKNNEMLRAFHRAATLAEHLIRGEEAHPELFDFFVSLLNYVDEVASSPQIGRLRGGAFFSLARAPEHGQAFEKVHPPLVPDSLPVAELAAGLELFAVIRVLDMLGYWSGEKLPDVPDAAVLQKCIVQKTEFVAMINEGIRGSQIT